MSIFNYKGTGVGMVLSMLSLATGVQAQSGVSLYHLGTKTIQINQFNPAHQAEGTFNLALPFISKQSISVKNAFSFNDIFEKTSAGKYRLLNDKLYQRVEDNGFLSLEVDKMTLFQTGFTFPKLGWGVTVFSNLTSSNQFFYSKGLFQGLLGGTAQSIGQELVMDNAQLSSLTYADVGIGVQRAFLDNKLKVGANVKYLMGVAYLESNRNLRLSVITDPDTYEMTFTTRDISFEYALPVGRAGVALSDQEEWEGNFSPTKNTGFALDLGATYSVLDKLEVSFSVTDLGAITWKDMSKEYVEDKTFTFSGVDLEENDENLADSLEKYFDLQYARQGNKKVQLPTRFLLSTKYAVTPKDAFSLTYLSVLDPRALRNLYALGYTRTFGDILAISLNAVKQPQQVLGLGVGTAVKAGGTQFYIASDNLLGAFRMSDTRGTDLRFGMNLIFGSKAAAKKAEDSKN